MRRISTIGIVMVMALVLASCGSRGKISTKDNSADYKAARQLPPLKKPSRVLASPAPARVSEVAVQESVPATDIVVAESVDIVSSSGEITAEITNLRNNIARLKIASEFDGAWDYLSARLARSSVTIFSRNKSAGRFAIGCSAFDSVQDQKSSGGGWTIFKRNRPANNEYCALSLSSARGNTIVSAIDRDGDEVGKAGAEAVFQQILNN